MKKYIKLLFVAFFATMTLSLYSCKSDNDEPKGDPSNGNYENYYFTVNGKKYYYAYEFYNLGYDLNSAVTEYNENSVFKKKVICCMVEGFNKVISYDDLTGSVSKPFSESSGITEDADFQIYLDYFDFNKTAEGTELKITDFTTPSWAVSKLAIIEVDENGSIYNNRGDYNGYEYEWTSRNDVQGSVKFVSYKDNLLTLKFEDVVMPSTEGSSTATLSGTIVFDTENSSTIP
ncbi:MAG: hypothetical protein J1E95_08550 [Muribaculaceae bacterium]|nr:hypothetical protein [Muribaculaceae bacterium]